MAFRSSASVGWAATTGGTVTKPSGTASGDLIVICAQNGGGTGQTITWPSGFTQALTQGADGMSRGVAWKVAGGSEPANYSVSFSGSDYGIAIAASYTGRNSSTPVNISGTSTPTPSGSGTGPWSIASTGVTTTADGCDILLFGSFGDNGPKSITAVTAPSGHTTREYINSTSTPWNKGYLTDGPQTTQGATGTLTAEITCNDIPDPARTATSIVLALAPTASSSYPVNVMTSRQGVAFATARNRF